LVQCKKGTTAQGSDPIVIVFSIVSEPPADRPDEPCVDLCSAEWSLCDMKQEGRIRLPLQSFEKDKRVESREQQQSDDGLMRPILDWGELELEWTGLAVIEKALVLS
jgi:hypothetical protein